MILDKQKINKYYKQLNRNHSSNPSIFSYKSKALRTGFLFALHIQIVHIAHRIKSKVIL